MKKAIREQNQLINGQMFIVLKILLATHMQIPDKGTTAQRYLYIYISMKLTMAGHKMKSNCADQSKCLVKNTQYPKKIVDENQAKDLINVA